MRDEAPMIQKALKLVSAVVMITMVALAAAGAYSIYSEFSALSGLQNSISGGNFNGSNFNLSNIVIPNNMTFPIELELFGNVSLGGYLIAGFDSGSQEILPGRSGNISLSTFLNYTKAIENPSLLDSMLFSSQLAIANTSVSASVPPLLSLTFVRAANTRIGPILGNFNASLNFSGASPCGSSYCVPLILSWNNSSPITFTGSLSMVLVKYGSQPMGNYGNATGQLSVNQGSNSPTFNFITPLSDYSAIASSSSFLFNTTLTVYGSSYTFLDNVTQ
jgi:hypothetical protein